MGKGNLQRYLRHAVVQTWMISSATALIAAIPVNHARGGELMDCEPQLVRGDGRHWAYRIIDGRECWYPGQPGRPKGELRWREAPSTTQESPVSEQPDVEARAPAQAPQKLDAVDQAEVEASLLEPTLEPLAAVPEPDINKVMPDQWRAAAADQLIAFTCCWPDLPTAAAWTRRKTGPAASLATDPAAARALRDVVKEAQAAACDRFRPAIRVILVALVASRGPPRRACERRAQAPHAGRRCHQLTHQCSTPNQTGPHRRDYSASCSAQSPTGPADRGRPSVNQSWRLASDEVPAD